MFTGKESGKRVIVGGMSPHVLRLPRDLLFTGSVIGVNRFYRFHPCDYWIGLDPSIIYRDRSLEIWDGFENLTCLKLTRKKNPIDPLEACIPDDFFDVWVNLCENLETEASTTWDGTLKYRSTSATSAIHWAILMGASEVVLFGVDLARPERWDGTDDTTDPDFWAPHVPSVNALLALFQKHVRIYKTNPESPLAVPMLPELEAA